MAGSTSLGWITPFDWSSFLLRFWPGAVVASPGVVSGLAAWANAEPATSAAPATHRQSRKLMAIMYLQLVDVRSVPSEPKYRRCAAGGPHSRALAAFSGRLAQRASAAAGLPEADPGPRPPAGTIRRGHCSAVGALVLEPIPGRGCSATIWMGKQRQSGWPFWRSRRGDDCRGATITQALFCREMI